MIYLDNAATTRFKPWAVKRAVMKELNNSANPGRSSHDTGIRAGLLVESCREEIAKRIFDGDVIFTKNCTEALNLGIFGISPKKQVITSLYEHNSVLRPLKFLADRGDIELKIIDHSDESALIRALKTPTSLVVLSAMSNVTGKAFDIGGLSKIIKTNSDAKILVDMAQGAGHLKPDLKYVDMCAFSGHKSLHGVQGTGFLAIKKGLSLQPRIFGGTGTSSLSIKHPNTIPDGMEAGTVNTPGIVALREGIRWTYKNFDEIKRRITETSDFIFEGLKNINKVKIYGCNNGIILFNIDGIAPDKTADYLNMKHKIAVRAGLQCAPLVHKKLGTAPYGAVRISVGYKNDLRQAEKTITAIQSAVTSL